MGMTKILSPIFRVRNFSSSKRSFTVGKITFNKSAGFVKVPEVPGLSGNCVKVPGVPVGPGAAKNTDYKNPEYFCYNNTSYFEAEVEMLKYRCPQPSTSKPYHLPISK